MIRTLGALGPLVFMVIYVAATVAAIPGSALSIAGGALFGSFWGVIVTLHAAVMGAGLAFLISRYFARESVVRWLGKNEKFQRLHRLTEEHGAIIVALTRLVPIFPFNLLYYGFGLTKVPFWTYVFWSWLCIAPGSILYVVGSDAVFTVLARGEIPWVLVGVLLVVTVVLHPVGARRPAQTGHERAGRWHWVKGDGGHPGIQVRMRAGARKGLRVFFNGGAGLRARQRI